MSPQFDMSPPYRRRFDADQLILGIETSCDDTACALLAGDGRVVSSVVSSQLEAHRPFGGVVPEIASREHLRNWPSVSSEAFERAGCTLDDVALVAATRGPGLVGSLLVGLTLGRTLAFARSLPFFGVHHLEGHLYSPFLDADGGAGDPPVEHFVGVVVSGGHSSFFDVRAGRVTSLGETRDDAIGEAFDKIGKRLGLPFPGGPIVDALAELVEPPDEPLFAIPSCGDTLDVSYSGLKTQALQHIDRMERAGQKTDLSAVHESLRVEGLESAEDARPALELLAAFRQAAVGQVLDRLESYYGATASAPEVVAVSGGVAANRHLRRELATWAEERGLDLRLVPLRFSGDNAAMIAHAALLRSAYSAPDDPRRVDAFSRGSLGE